MLDQDVQGALSVLLQELHVHVVKGRDWKQLDMVVELFELAELQELNDVLERGQRGPHDVFVLLRCALPDRVDQVVLYGVLHVDGAQVRQLKRALDQLSVRIFNVNVLQDLRLGDPI